MQLSPRLAVACLTALAAVPAPQTLVLHGSDLPRGFAGTPGRAQRVSNRQAAQGGPAGFERKLDLWHRIGGYLVDFSRPVAVAGLQEGPLEIQSAVSVYGSPGGARAAFDYARRNFVPPDTSPITLDFRLGDAAREYVSQRGSALGALLVYTLVWRDRNVNASLVVVGRLGVVSAADIEPLARAQETRILAHRRSARDTP